MNPITNMRNVNKMNDQELQMGLTGTTNSWHEQYRNSAWIFAGGLSFDLSEGDIICVFSQYGEIVNINLVRDAKTGRSKGYAFLCYEDQRSTVLAVDNLNGATIAKRAIRVDHVNNYRPPKDREGSAGDMDEGIDLKKELKTRGCGPDVADELRDLERKKAELEALLSKEESHGECPRSREDRVSKMPESRRENDRRSQSRRSIEQTFQSKRENSFGYHFKRENDQGYLARRDNEQAFQSRREDSTGYQARRIEGQTFQSRRDVGQTYMRRDDPSYGRRGDNASFHSRRDENQGFRRDSGANNRNRGRFMTQGQINRNSRPGWNSGGGYNQQKMRLQFNRQQQHQRSGGGGGNLGGFRAGSGGAPRQFDRNVDRRYNEENRGGGWSKERRNSYNFSTIHPQRNRMMGSSDRQMTRRRRSRS